MKDKFTLTKSMLEKYIEDFIDDEILDEKATKTYTKYALVARNFKYAMLETKNEEISKKSLIDYKSKMIEKYSTKTVNNYIIIINKFIKYIELNENDDYSKKKLKKHVSDYCLKTIKEQERTSIEDVLEPADFKRMLRMSKKKGMIQDHMIMKVLAYTGIRVGELQYFTLENIEQAKQYITIYNKGKERDVPLRSDLRRELLKYAKSQKIESGTLFPGKKDPQKMLTEKTIREHIKKICGMCRGIDLDKAHPHAFRHMFAIQWINENGNSSLSELAKIMGHSDVKTTAIYTNTSQKEKKRKVEAIKY